ncbi:MAG: hypothetical protein HQ568_03625 [Calditrichaeota bacterium]|nr:hypothetical protein [Calditrichota bacterium]
MPIIGKNHFLLLIAVLLLIGNTIAGYTVERGTVGVFCNVSFVDSDNQRELLFENQLNHAVGMILPNYDFKVFNVSDVPLISKEMLQYTLVENADLKGDDVKTGRLKFELGSDGSAKIESEQGFTAYTSVEISSVSWIIDQEKAVKLIKNSCDYALFITANAEDITNKLSNSNQFSGQRSIRCELLLKLVSTKDNTIVKSFSNEVPSMGSHGLTAANEGWKSLVENAFNQWFKDNSGDKQ